MASSENTDKTDDSVSGLEAEKIEATTKESKVAPEAHDSETKEVKPVTPSSNEESLKENNTALEKEQDKTGKPVEKKKRKEKECTKSPKKKVKTGCGTFKVSDSDKQNFIKNKNIFFNERIFTSFLPQSSSI